MPAHAHMHGVPTPNTLTESHTHSPTPPQGGDPWNQSKVNKNVTNQDISILFEDFKFVQIPPPTYSHIHTQPPHPPPGGPPNLLKCDKTWMNQNNSILFEDLWFIETPHPWVGVFVVGWMGGSMGGFRSND